MVKISEFMIGIVLVSLIVAIFGLFMADMSQNYSLSYDNDSIEVYNKLDDISAHTRAIQDETTGISEKSGVLDIIGSYFSDAYRVLILTKDSFDIFDKMSNRAVDDANLGAAGRYIRIAVSTITLILIFIAVILSSIIKRES